MAQPHLLRYSGFYLFKAEIVKGKVVLTFSAEHESEATLIRNHSHIPLYCLTLNVRSLLLNMLLVAINNGG